MSTPPHKKDKAESLQTSIACKGSVCWVVALGLSCASRAWTLTGFACLLATDGNGDGTLRRRRVQVVGAGLHAGKGPKCLATGFNSAPLIVAP
jgi:hypothetical protein